MSHAGDFENNAAKRHDEIDRVIDLVLREACSFDEAKSLIEDRFSQRAINYYKRLYGTSPPDFS